MKIRMNSKSCLFQNRRVGDKADNIEGAERFLFDFIEVY
ncbi:hypothetical protein LEP1GSC108_0137 [Leptospira weilii str. UI 13098]|uniref:Uncharacterized protein n=1 Tax=Leptospira weilii str. UI 13098 TaxID=1088542 RepID=M6QAT5_9LEPT|nr:hypothetical protein LEP1GSC108_0137 [Leptospira weilii str. UI 13098]